MYLGIYLKKNNKTNKKKRPNKPKREKKERKKGGTKKGMSRTLACENIRFSSLLGETDVFAG